jgi:hypothetical protein
MNRRHFLAAVATASFSPAFAADAIPAHLVGIWAPTDTVLNKQGLVTQGTALYIWPDGKGASIAGPPAKGVALAAIFWPAKSEFSLIFLQGTKVIGQAKAAYDPKTKTIRPLVGNAAHLMYRRFAEIDPSIRRFMAL